MAGTDKMEDVNEVFDPNTDPGLVEVVRIQVKEGRDYRCAWDLFYFRQSKNWTIELEWELIKRHSEGRPPLNLAKFGYPNRLAEIGTTYETPFSRF